MGGRGIESDILLEKREKGKRVTKERGNERGRTRRMAEDSIGRGGERVDEKMWLGECKSGW